MYCCSCLVCIVVSCPLCIVVVVLCVLLLVVLLYCCSFLVCIVVVLLCVLLSSYVYLLHCVCIAVFILDAGLLAISQYFGRSCDRPPRHRFFLASLCLKAIAEMVPNIPSCHYMLLMWPSRLKFSSNQIHALFTCKTTTATG